MEGELRFATLQTVFSFKGDCNVCTKFAFFSTSFVHDCGFPNFYVFLMNFSDTLIRKQTDVNPGFKVERVPVSLVESVFITKFEIMVEEMKVKKKDKRERPCNPKQFSL